MTVASFLKFLYVLAAIISFAASQTANTKPAGHEFVERFSSPTYYDSKFKLSRWLLTGVQDQSLNRPYTAHDHTEYEGYDGWYNNPSRPELGAIDTPLLRRVPAAYADGSYEPSGGSRPNPLTLSEQLLIGKENDSKSRTGKNALLVFFGQQVVEEILDAQRAACPPEYFNIPIPENHTYRVNAPRHTELPLLRTRYDARTGFSPNNPRQQLNEITPYLDGGLMYGTTKAWSDVLRTYQNETIDKDGLLAYSEGGLFPEYNKVRLPMANPPPPANHSLFVKNHELFNVNRFFMLGNPRGNENTFLLSFGILWFRWHNQLARTIRQSRPLWSSDKVFNEARKWVIATQQHIVVNVWLPTWLGEDLKDYEGYDPSIDPQIDQFFQAAAFRFGHTLVPPGVYLRDYGRNGCGTGLRGWPKVGVRTCNSFWNPQNAIKSRYNNTEEMMDIDRLLMGMAFQLCEEEDHKIIEDLRGNVFGPLEFSRRDLMAVNIQRARDHGLPDFNTARQAYGLPRVTNRSHFRAVASTVLDAFERLYNHSYDNIDIWVGGIMETEDGPGELFRTIIADQFRRIRDGDRFWFENKANGLFNDDEIQRIKQLTLYDIIMSVTKMEHNDIQPNPFLVPTNNTHVHENCRLEEGTCMRDVVTGNPTNLPCFHLPQLTRVRLDDNCTQPATYDYFSNSQVSYILTFIGIGTVIIGLAGSIWLLTHLKRTRGTLAKSFNENVRKSFSRKDKHSLVPYTAQEWIKAGTPYRHIVMLLNTEKMQLQVLNQAGGLIRGINLSVHENGQNGRVTLFIVNDGLHVMFRSVHEYDLVVKFESEYLRKSFLESLEVFLAAINVERDRVMIGLRPAFKQAVSSAARQKTLEMFFRVVFSQAFKIKHNQTEILNVDSKLAMDVIYTELTLNEFADALSMKPNSSFVIKMFRLIDKDQNGFVSFREFVDMLVIFASGSADDKLKLMFDMYDINGTGQLTNTDFKNMIKSLMETVNAEVDQKDLDKVVQDMLGKAQLTKKKYMTFEDFKILLQNDKSKLESARLGFHGVPKMTGRQSFITQATETVESIYSDPRDLRDRVAGADAVEEAPIIDTSAITQEETGDAKKVTIYGRVCTYVASNNREIFWLATYTLVLWAIFAERAYYYSVEREHSGLRRIAGYGVTVTRGAASAMMFTYSTMLLTMCKNTITTLRDTRINLYVPLDAAVEMHKYIACWALFFTVLHIVGHAFNFYHIATQTSDDLTCLFRNYFHATHEIPKFHYWCWQTITGVTGVLLTIVGALIYIFAVPYVRRKLYNWFWTTHSLYPIFFILMILHGAGRLIQPPFFHYFFLGPVILFGIDKIISGMRKTVEIPVLKAELLPSNVTMLEFKKPNNFEYKAGQWVRISCLELSKGEFHPFTLSSSPDERNLTVHIRAVGPWTTNIRRVYDPAVITGALPKIHLDGPYGEAHQDWYQYDVSILVGGGIGVTPFASILKDIVFRANVNVESKCKKVYFLWVARTQRQFEWLVDIIREMENTDLHGRVSVHIFVTEFYEKYDLRTILLYICERHFQKSAGRSLFTGLRATTHFGRPKFTEFFKCIQSLHSTAQNIGVFSCGPHSMIRNVDNATSTVNDTSNDGQPSFVHFYKNF